MFEILEFKQTPNLQEMSEPVLFIESNKTLLKDFFKFAKRQSNAAGLASNQVGLIDRFIAVRTVDGWVLAINPSVKALLGKSSLKIEGCLSWPGKDILAKRNSKVIITYYDLNGDKKDRFVKDSFESQVWQHEINHLNGIEEQMIDKKL